MLDKTRPENTRLKFFSTATTLLFVTLLGGCSLIPFLGSDEEEDVDIEAIETTEQKLYSQAQRSLRSSNFSLAIEQLELMEARFPFGRFAEQSQLELIYAHYMTADTEAARAGADRFIRLHPGHDSVDYAYYLRALAAYKNDPGVLDKLVSAKPDSDRSTRSMCAGSGALPKSPRENETVFHTVSNESVVSSCGTSPMSERVIR